MLIISLVERLKQLLFLSVVTIALFLVSLTYGQEYGKHNYIANEVQLPYRVLLPEGYEKNSQKMYPLIIFLHGIGERGSDNELQLVHCSDFFKKTTSVRNGHPLLFTLNAHQIVIGVK